MTTHNSSSMPTGIVVKPGCDNDAKAGALERFLRECGVLWNRPITTALREAWMRRIEPYTYEALVWAFEEYLTRAEYFPVPGTLIPIVKERLNCREDGK